MLWCRPLQTMLLCVLAAGVPGCRLLAGELSCTRAEHCPYGFTCGAGGVCEAGGEPPRDAGPDPDGVDGGMRPDAGPDDDAGPGVDAGTPGPAQWWSDDWAVAVPLEVTGGSRWTTDVPVVVEAPLAARMGGLTLDVDSPRVIEETENGHEELPSFFSHDQGQGLLAFVLPGELSAGVTRRVWVYLAATEEGDVAPPSYWRDETRNPVAGPTVAIDDLDSVPLRTFHMTEPGFAAYVNISWRLWSTGVDHYAAPYPLGGALFTLLQPSRVRLETPALVIVEATATAGPARLRQLTLLTSERGALTALRVDGLAPGAPLEVYAYDDIDLPDIGASDDTGLVDASVSAAVVEDPAIERMAALIHDGRAALETVGVLNDVVSQVQSRTLSGTDQLEGTGDAVVACRWDFAAVDGPVLVRSATVFVDGRGDADTIQDRFFAPTATLGAEVPRP